MPSERKKVERAFTVDLDHVQAWDGGVEHTGSGEVRRHSAEDCNYADRRCSLDEEVDHHILEKRMV